MKYISKNKIGSEIERRTSYPPFYESGSFFKKRGSSFSSSVESDSIKEVEGFHTYAVQLVLFLTLLFAIKKLS